MTIPLVHGFSKRRNLHSFGYESQKGTASQVVGGQNSRPK